MKLWTGKKVREEAR